jgi:hypothetical protein
MVDNTVEDAQPRVNPYGYSEEEYDDLEKEIAIDMYRRLAALNKNRDMDKLLRLVLKVAIIGDPDEVCLVCNALAECISLSTLGKEK